MPTDATDDPPQDDLDALVRRVDPDRWLSSRFIADAQARADVIALYAYDHELARAPRVASNPLLGEIRLTWWREVLDQVYGAQSVRRHPTAQALADVVARRAIPREILESMIDARYRLLDPEPLNADEAKILAVETAGQCASAAILILDREHWKTSSPGVSLAALWGLARLWGSGRVGEGARAELLEEIGLGLAEARRAPAVPVAAFPAVAHAALTPAAARQAEVGLLGKQARILWAVLRGRV